MGIKIVELPATDTIQDLDLFPVSQENSGHRDTYRITASQIGSYVNSGPYEAITETNDRITGLVLNANSDLINYINSNFLTLSGGMMTGSIDFNGNKMSKFSGNVIEVTENTALDESHNGAIILATKNNLSDPDDRILLNVDNIANRVGYNALIIQGGSVQAKVSRIGAATIASADGGQTSRKQYSQINLFVVKQNLIWVSGDLV